MQVPSMQSDRVLDILVMMKWYKYAILGQNVFKIHRKSIVVFPKSAESQTESNE